VTVAPQRVGAFRFYFDDQRWEWSEQVQRMHGYQPGTVTPTTELVLSHKYPDDRDQIAQSIDTIRRTGQPLSSRHRIVDTSGKVRSVVVVGDQLHDERGRVVGTQGFYIDTTPDEREQQDLVTAMSMSRFSKCATEAKICAAISSSASSKSPSPDTPRRRKTPRSRRSRPGGKKFTARGHE